MKWAAPVLVREIHPHIAQKEKTKVINRYLEEIKPLLLILRIFGRFPFVFEDGCVLFKPLSWPVWYSLLLVLLQLLGACYIMDMIISLGFSSKDSFNDSLYFICLAASLVQSLAIPFTYWCELSKTLKYINDWHRFQEEFGEDELDFALTRPIKIVSIIHAQILISILLAGAYFFKDTRVIILAPVLSAMGSLSASMFVFCTTLYELRSASKKLLKRIFATDCHSIYKNRTLWLKLSNLTSEFGEIVGYTGLVALILLFTTFVLVTYGILSLAIDQNYDKSFCILLCISLFCISNQFIVCDAAHRTTKAVGEDFLSELIELNTSLLSHKGQFEITVFLKTMMTNPPVVHFVSFLTINRSLFVKFISYTVKYLVVLIQFKASASDATSLVDSSTEDLRELSTNYN